MDAKSKRLDGLDFARFIAFAGMVYVNFHVVTGSGSGAFWAEAFLLSLEGKAAATFVILAGVGLGMGYARAVNGFNLTIIKRAIFLFVIGMINAAIFPADILHYYAIYFIFALFFISLSTKMIAFFALLLPLIFMVLVFIFDYETSWNWKTLDYADFWTIQGFLRNLFFNGFHPVLPWLSFLLFGIIISRFDLYAKKTQHILMVFGVLALALAYLISFALINIDAEFAEIVGVSPMPPLPLYMLAGAGSGALIIGVSLALFSNDTNKFGTNKFGTNKFGTNKLLKIFTITGKQALTLYIAHIIIGMGILEALNMIGGQNAQIAFFSASIFILISIFYANIHNRFFNKGPFEWLMRKIAG